MIGDLVNFHLEINLQGIRVILSLVARTTPKTIRSRPIIRRQI